MIVSTSMMGVRYGDTTATTAHGQEHKSEPQPGSRLSTHRHVVDQRELSGAVVTGVSCPGAAGGPSMCRLASGLLTAGRIRWQQGFVGPGPSARQHQGVPGRPAQPLAARGLQLHRERGALCLGHGAPEEFAVIGRFAGHEKLRGEFTEAGVAQLDVDVGRAPAAPAAPAPLPWRSRAAGGRVLV